MIEIAISLAVIGFALVAIIGILPIGMTVQKDNREQTIINFDSSYLMDAIRSGVDASYVQNPAGRVLGIDVLTNYVLAITNVSTLYDINGNRIGKPQTRYYTASNYCFDGGTQVTSPALTNGLIILGLLSQPKYVYNPANSPAGSYYSNSIVADIRAITGSQMDQGSSAASKDFAFTYRVTVEMVPSAAFPFTWAEPGNGVENFSAPGLLVQSNALSSNDWAFARNLQANLNQIRLSFRWPVLPGGKMGTGGQAYRSSASGQLVEFNNARLYPKPPIPFNYFLIQPQFYAAQP